jgi:hypothetical protein
VSGPEGILSDAELRRIGAGNCRLLAGRYRDDAARLGRAAVQAVAGGAADGFDAAGWARVGATAAARQARIALFYDAKAAELEAAELDFSCSFAGLLYGGRLAR